VTAAGSMLIPRCSWSPMGSAHWFAFRVSARLVGSGTIRPHDAEAVGAQLTGAATVALLATIPVVVLPRSDEFDVIRLVLAGFIALVGYAVARSSGASRGRSMAYAASVLIVAIVVAVVKNVLAGPLSFRATAHARGNPSSGRSRSDPSLCQ
jgi:hypothetical protein